MTDRRSARIRVTVTHRHRIGEETVPMVSELAYLHGNPKAILRWIDIGGQRTPLCVDLDPSKLIAPVDGRPVRRFLYSGTTVDPRGESCASDNPEAERTTARG